MLKIKYFHKTKPFYSFVKICFLFFFLFTETWIHLIMLKGDMEINFPDRVVDHPITVGKLIPSTSPVQKTEAPCDGERHKCPILEAANRIHVLCKNDVSL